MGSPLNSHNVIIHIIPYFGSSLGEKLIKFQVFTQILLPYFGDLWSRTWTHPSKLLFAKTSRFSSKNFLSTLISSKYNLNSLYIKVSHQFDSLLWTLCAHSLGWNWQSISSKLIFARNFTIQPRLPYIWPPFIKDFSYIISSHNFYYTYLL